MNLYQYHLSDFNKEAQQTLLNDSGIIKFYVGNKEFKSGSIFPNFTIKGISMLDALKKGQEELLKRIQPDAIIVSEDHPDLWWIVLQARSSLTS